MNGDIRVTVNCYGTGRNLVLRWTDPITGQRKAESAGTTNAKTAERWAGEKEGRLRAGLCDIPTRMTWADFRERYEGEHLATLAQATQESAESAFRHIERVLNPSHLAAITSGAMSRFQRLLREEGMRDTTLASHLRHLKAAFRWAVRKECLSVAPDIDMPRKAKGQRVMKGRPITTEEFERMLLAVPKVRPHDALEWKRFLTGLWLSGLRRGEALSLTWGSDGPVSVCLTGKHPCLRFRAEGQKSGRAEVVPIAPDFAEFLLATPEAERRGRVFKLAGPDGGQLSGMRVGVVVAKIGKRARVVVNEEGKPAGCHDYRRAFGTRWSRKVMPATLQRLMRHGSVQTTMRYYVDLDADAVADDLWKAHEAGGSKGWQHFGNTAPKSALKPRGKR